MSLATHAMTKNAHVEAARPSMHHNASLDGITFNNMFKPAALGLTDAMFAHGRIETPFPPRAQFTPGHAWGHPWMPYSTAGMPSVDMLVLPKPEPTNEQRHESTDSDLKVSYTSAVDLANALFPTHTTTEGHVHSRLEQLDADIGSLSGHRDQMEEGLLNHKQELINLGTGHKFFKDELQAMDEGLGNHTAVLKELQKSSVDVLKRLKKHQTDLDVLASQVALTQASGAGKDVNMQMSELKATTKKQMAEIVANTEKLHSRFRSHANEMAEQVDSVKKKVEGLNRSHQEVHRGLQQHTSSIDSHTLELNSLNVKNIASNAHVARLSSAVQNTSARPPSAVVDFAVLAPRRR